MFEGLKAVLRGVERHEELWKEERRTRGPSKEEASGDNPNN